jgi:hypothetical protein
MNKKILCGAVLLLAVLHQDCWFWYDTRLVLGFVPVGLAYHVGYCFMASLVMALLVKYAWPSWLENVEASAADAQNKEKDV